jgi:hypothetical protein
MKAPNATESEAEIWLARLNLGFIDSSRTEIRGALALGAQSHQQIEKALAANVTEAKAQLIL